MSNVPFPRMPTVVAVQGQRLDPGDYVGLFMDMRGPQLPRRGKLATHLVTGITEEFDDQLRTVIRVVAYCLRTGGRCVFRLRKYQLHWRKI